MMRSAHGRHLGARTAALKRMAGCEQLIERYLILCGALGLAHDRAIGMQSQELQITKLRLLMPQATTIAVHIFDADPPFATELFSEQPATQCGHHGAKVQRPRGRGCKSTADSRRHGSGLNQVEQSVQVVVEFVVKLPHFIGEG